MSDTEDHSVDAAAAKIFAMFQGGNNTEAQKEPEEKQKAQPEPQDDAQAEQASGDGEAQDDNAAVEGENLEDAAEESPEPKPQAPKAKSNDELDRALREAEKSKLETDAAKNDYLNKISTIIPQLQASIVSEFPEVKDRAELRKLMVEDPGRYNDLMFKMQDLQIAQNEQARVQGLAFEKYVRDEGEALAKALPEISDPVKGPVLKAKLWKFAEEQGYTAQQLGMASARDVLTIHRAMLYEDSVKAQAKAKEKAANAPPVQKPGARPTQNAGQVKVQENVKRLQKTGSLDDAAALLKQLGI